MREKKQWWQFLTLGINKKLNKKVVIVKLIARILI